MRAPASSSHHEWGRHLKVAPPFVESGDVAEHTRREPNFAGAVVTENDHRLVRNLYARYCHALDDCDEIALATCFSPDATVTVIETNLAVDAPPAPAPRVMETRAGIVTAMMQAARARVGYRHWVTNLHLDVVDDDHITGIADFQVVTERAVTESFGRDRDEIVRDPSGEWTFSSRLIDYRYRIIW